VPQSHVQRTYITNFLIYIYPFSSYRRKHIVIPLEKAVNLFISRIRRD